MTSPAARPLPAFLTAGLGDRVLLGALAALIVARPLVHGDDPGRLRLTTSGGAMTFNLCVWLVFLGFAVWRVVIVRSQRGLGGYSSVFTPMLLLVAIMVIRSSDAYRRPSEFVFWELVTLAPVYFITRQLAGRVADRRGLVNVFLASAVSVAAIGVVQRVGPVIGMPSTEPVIVDARPGLVGDDEFQAVLNSAATPAGPVHGTLESPEAYLVFLLIALPLAVAMSRSAGSRFKIALPVMLIGGVLAVFAGPAFSTTVATSYSAGFRLFWDNLGTGVGGGNFSRAAGDGNVASGSAWLTMLATLGLMGCGVLAMSVGLMHFLLPLIIKPPALLAQAMSMLPPLPEEPEPSHGTRWEFYLGGIAGLLGGFVLAVGQMPAESPVWEVYKIGGYAVGRGVVWLAAFGLLERLRPTPAAIKSGLLAGLGVVILAGVFSEAAMSATILFPAVVLLTMLVAVEEQRIDMIERPWTRPVGVAAAVVTSAIVVYYLLTAAAPAWATADAVRKARMASRLYPDVERQIELAKNNIERANARTKAVNFLNGQILNPLRAAAERDPNNAALLLEIARWERPLWRQLLYVDPAAAAQLGRDILKRADKAAKLDPKNIAGEQAILEALFLYRKESNSKPAERLEAFNNHLAKVAERMPTLEVPYRHRMVMTLLTAGDAEGVEPEIAKLFRLNRVDGQPHGAMTDAQRQEVIDRAKATIQNPPKELLDDWTR